MDKFVVLPMLIAAIMLAKGKEPRDLFITIFLPFLTLIPTYYQTKLVGGLPEISFWSAALIPIFAVWAFRDKMPGYKFSFLDAIIIGNVLIIFVSQLSATGYKDAQKLLFVDTAQRIIPYIMMKAIFMRHQMRIKSMHMMIILSVIISPFMFYEMIKVSNVLDEIWRNRWPGSVPWGGVMWREGLKRASGTFAHPICAGYFYALIVPICFWYWNHKHKWSKVAWMNKWWFGAVMFGFCVLGIITAVSRAPMLGMGISLAVIGFGWTRYRAAAGAVLFAGFLGVMVTVVPKFVAYVSVTRAETKDEDQRNAAYRKEMLDNYFEVINQSYYLGYGRFTFPVVKGQASIDNEYLFMALTHGMIAFKLYLLTMGWVLVKLLIFGLKTKPQDPVGRLAWCLLAAWICAIFTQATVYAGTQPLFYFYMYAGMSEAILLNPTTDAKKTEVKPLPGVGYGYNFSRTI